jgi:Ca-activated chloride channel family protein
MQFANAWMLYALWLAPVLGLIGLTLYRRRARALENFLSPAMRQKLCPPPQPQRFYWQWSCLLAGSALVVIAAARPQWGLREETVIQRSRDLVIALDVSRSMLARDVHPSRLLRAKADIQDLLRELRGDRAALVAFRGRAVLLCPLTTDYGYLETVLNDISVESAPRGETDLGDAIEKSLAAFESDRGSHQAIVLISDGEDLAGKAQRAAEDAKKREVVIFTVGLGDVQGAKIPSAVKSNEVMMYQGQEVVTKLETATLKTIAETTGGAYVPVGVANVKLGELYRNHLSKIRARDTEESIQRRWIERFQWFLGPGLVLLLVAALLSRGRLAKAPAPARPPPLAVPTHPRPIPGSEQDHAKTSKVLAPPPRPAWKPALHWKKLAMAVDSWRVGFHPDRLSGGFARGSSSLESCPVILKQGGVVKPTSVDSQKYAPSFALALLLTGSLAIHAAAASNSPAPPAALPSDAPAASVSTTAAPSPKIRPGREGARQAQNLYLLGKYREAAAAYLQAAQESSQQLRNTLTYNAACALYHAGQYQAAADKFAEVVRDGEPAAPQWLRRPSARAAAGNYNAGCALFRLAEQAVGGSESNRNYGARPTLLEQSGQAFQRALRLNTDLASARDNLATVVQALPEAREQAKTHALLEKYGKSPPDQVADEMLTGQRKLMEDLAPILTNATPARIEMLEALAARQRQNTDLLIPMRAGLANAMSAAPALSSNAPANPQQQMAELNQHLDAVKNVMQESREALRNLDNNAWGSVATAEAGIYTLWKALADFYKVLREDMRRQTNAITLTTQIQTQVSDTVHANTLAQQEEAGKLTQLFTNRFIQAVPPEGLKPPPAPSNAPPAKAPGGTNAPARSASTNEAGGPAEEEGITPEKRARILSLAAEATARQAAAAKLLGESKLDASLTEQRASYKLLEEIEKLLPKQKNQQNQQQKPQEQPKPQPQPNEQPKPPKPEDQPPPENPQPPPEQPPPKPEDQPKPKEKEMTPEQARAILEKAQQREKEHQQEKMRIDYLPPSPVEKDW